MPQHKISKGIVHTFDTLRTYCIIYMLDALSFASGIQNVFLVEASNRNYTHSVFCIPQLRLRHKNTRALFIH